MELKKTSMAAFRGMIYLAKLYVEQDCGYNSLNEIAQNTGYSFDVTRRTFLFLGKTPWLDSSQGSRGGYRLSVPPESITLYDVLYITEGGVALAGRETARPGDGQTFAAVWPELQHTIESSLAGITLRDCV